MSTWEWAFWLAAAFVGYTYLGYPALLCLWRALRRGGEETGEAECLPFVSVILTVRNEADHIETKLLDLLRQDYPQDRLEILVASDQSTDGTNARVRALQERHP